MNLCIMHERRGCPRRSLSALHKRRAYWQAGAPSVVAGGVGAVFTKIAHVTPGRLLFVIVALQPPAAAVGPVSTFPCVTQKFTVPGVAGLVHDVVLLYFTESAK